MIEALADVVQSDASSATIAGVRIDALPFDAVVDKIIQRASSTGSPGYVVTPNAHHIVMLQDDEFFREIYRNAFLVVPDGMSLLWAAKLLGVQLRGRVNGTDLFEALCKEAAQRGLRIFLLGGRDGAAERAVQVLESRHPGLRICGFYCPPFGFENEPYEAEKVVARVSASGPDLLFVGLGAPKQEYWIYRHVERLRVPVSIGVGVSFEFVAGAVARAPRWMQNSGLEWLHRLCVEPRRLWRRYLFGNARFCTLIAGEFIAKRQRFSSRVQSGSIQPDVAFPAAAKEHLRSERRSLLEPVESVE